MKSRQITEEDIERALTEYKLKNSERDLRRMPLEREAAVLAAIREGRPQDLQFRKWDQVANHLGLATFSEKKGMDFNVAAAISLFTRTAIEGGMSPDNAYDLSDVLFQKLEKTETVGETLQIYYLAAVMFARKVHLAQSDQAQYRIEQCRIYISRNLFRKITLEDVAGAVGLNPSYLSNLFSTTMHITLHDYIQREKIEAACNMLKYSDRSISAIAAYLSFESQSNFSAVFRKWKDMTPSRYRNMFHKDNYSLHP